MALFYGVNGGACSLSIADLIEKVSCNCWKSNEEYSKNNAIIRIKFALFNKEYLRWIDLNQPKEQNETDFNCDG